MWIEDLPYDLTKWQLEFMIRLLSNGWAMEIVDDRIQAYRYCGQIKMTYRFEIDGCVYDAAGMPRHDSLQIAHYRIGDDNEF